MSLNVQIISLIWGQKVDEIYGDSPLDKEDRELLKYPGTFIGQTDYENQAARFEYFEIRIKERIEAARKDYAIKGSLYRKIGFFCGPNFKEIKQLVFALILEHTNAVAIHSNSKVDMTNCEFNENTATNHAGAVYVTYTKPEGATENINGTFNITDGVFSMDGDLAPLPEMADLADKYGAEVEVTPGAPELSGQNKTLYFITVFRFNRNNVTAVSHCNYVFL